MLVEKNVPLQPYNTFHIVAKAFSLVRVTGVDVLDQVLAACDQAKFAQAQPNATHRQQTIAQAQRFIELSAPPQPAVKGASECG